MKILGIIPARGGSKGLPGKNIKLLAGKPLIAHSIEAAINSELSKIIVSTDDETIAEVAKLYGAEVPFTRPADLASDHAKSLDVCMHALLTMEELDGVKYDAIMLLQPTAPFRTTNDINKAIELMRNNSNADSVISVVDVEGHHPARMKFLDKGVLVDPPFCETYENQNRQELKPMYIRNGAIYLTKREILLNNSYKGKNCLGLVMSKARSSNIDTLLDFKLAEFLYVESLLDA